MKTPSFIVFAFGLTLVIPRVVAQCSSCSSCLSCVVGPPDYLCPTPPTTLEVYAPHESYCTRFYKCVNGKAVEGRCPSGTFFNPVQNLCCPDESLCYRANPCVLPVPGCANCESTANQCANGNQFVNSEMLASAFFVCNCDGTGVTNQCPMAFDPCTNSTVQLVFTDGNCDPPAEVTTTTTEETTTTTEEETTTTVEETTTTAEETTTTTEEETTTTTEEETTVEE